MPCVSVYRFRDGLIVESAMHHFDTAAVVEFLALGASAAAPEPPMLLVADLDVADPGKLARYGAEVQPLMAQHGGRILGVSAAGVDVVEGDWRPGLLIVHEQTGRGGFDAFWNSPEYQPVRRLRTEACRESRIAVFAGGAPGPRDAR